jgi:integrase
VAALAAECGSQGDVVMPLAYTGMRFGELVGLKVEDVDLKARRIRVSADMKNCPLADMKMPSSGQ